MMDSLFTSEQLELRDGVRAALKDVDGEDLAWSRLTEVGLPGALAMGLTELDLVLCLEETGRAALPVPIVETCLVGGILLPDRRISAALDGSGLVPWPAQAEVALVGDEHGVRVVEDPGTYPVPSTDPYRPLARVSGGEELAVDRAVLTRAVRAGTLGTAAQLIGLGARAVEMTVAYVGERKQFGVPVGSFQAVKHQLADAHLALEMARPLVYSAAWALVSDVPHAGRDVAAAKARASDAAALAARAALQCHGAMGYTREYPLHRWLTRIWALRVAWGTPAAQRAVLARELGLGGL